MLLSVSARMTAQTPAARPRFDAFEVATIKPVEPEARSGRYIKMESSNRFVGKHYTLKLLIAAAYDLNPRTISGGPSWVNDDTYDIAAVSPGAVQPNHDEQMTMLRALIAERFQLTYHREPKVFSIYSLSVAKGGPKLKDSRLPADSLAVLGPAVVYPEHVQLHASNATMTGFVSLLQRAVLDRPVVNNTGLAGRYDFVLDWAPDETQFGGGLPTPTTASTASPLFVAIKEQLGLDLEATRGPVATLVIDNVQRPSAN
jgi:uncharacterized protein (TIGR03435 family)